MASSSDLFIKASVSGKVPVAATLTNTHTSGSGLFECDSLDGWADVAAFIVYEIDSDGNPISGSKTSWVAVKNNKLLQNALLADGIDRDYPAHKTIVVADYTAEAHNRLITALLKIFKQDGALKNNVVDDKHITGVDGTKIVNDSIDGEKIKDSTIKLNHLDWESFGSANSAYKFDDKTYNSSAYGDLSPTDIGPSVTINVPTSGSVLVMVSCGIYGSKTPKLVSFAATAANNIEADDSHAARNDGVDAVVSSSCAILTGLNPGSTTFTLKYKGLNARFFSRKISVIPLI